MSGLDMSAYVDSDHAICLGGRRSISGGAVQLAGASIACVSRTQQVIPLSSSEAVYIAFAEIVKFSNLSCLMWTTSPSRWLNHPHQDV